MSIHVSMGEWAVGQSPQVMDVLGLGSCIVITLYDWQLKIGCLAHIAYNQAGDESISQMLQELYSRGSKKHNLEAKLIGAANMFKDVSSDSIQDSCSFVRERLKKEGIRIIAESTGGDLGRSVEFSLDTGIVTVKIKF